MNRRIEKRFARIRSEGATLKVIGVSARAIPRALSISTSTQPGRFDPDGYREAERGQPRTTRSSRRGQRPKMARSDHPRATRYKHGFCAQDASCRPTIRRNTSIVGWGLWDQASGRAGRRPGQGGRRPDGRRGSQLSIATDRLLRADEGGGLASRGELGTLSSARDLNEQVQASISRRSTPTRSIAVKGLAELVSWAATGSAAFAPRDLTESGASRFQWKVGLSTRSVEVAARASTMATPIATSPQVDQWSFDHR